MNKTKKNIALFLVVMMIFPMYIINEIEAKTIRSVQIKKVVNVKTTVGGTNVKLTWKRTKNAKVYEVFRSTKRSKGYRKIGVTRKRTFNARNQKEGQTFFYKVRATRPKKRGAVRGAFSSVQIVFVPSRRTIVTSIPSITPTPTNTIQNNVPVFDTPTPTTTPRPSPTMPSGEALIYKLFGAPDEKIIDTATLDSEISNDTVIIIFTKEASRNNKDYTIADFEGIDIVKISDTVRYSAKEYADVESLWITEKYIRDIVANSEEENSPELSEAINQYMLARNECQGYHDNYRRIIQIKLAVPCKENVLWVIKQLQHREDIRFVGPSYIGGSGLE